MTYIRVIPRDLFNEANLLKCMGQLYLKTENADTFAVEEIFQIAGEPFRVFQSDDDGSIHLTNVILIINGNTAGLSRPLNSREPWPLYVNSIGSTELDEPIEVFTDDGELTPEFLQLGDVS